MKFIRELCWRFNKLRWRLRGLTKSRLGREFVTSGFALLITFAPVYIALTYESYYYFEPTSILDVITTEKLTYRYDLAFSGLCVTLVLVCQYGLPQNIVEYFMFTVAIMILAVSFFFLIRSNSGLLFTLHDLCNRPYAPDKLQAACKDILQHYDASKNLITYENLTERRYTFGLSLFIALLSFSLGIFVGTALRVISAPSSCIYDVEMQKLRNSIIR